MFGLEPTDRFAVLGSPVHSLWAYAAFRADQLGARCLGIDRLDKQHLSQLIDSEISVIYAVPELLVAAAKVLVRETKGAPFVRRVLLGGGAVGPTFPFEIVQKAFPSAQLWVFYGSAEASFVGYSRVIPDGDHFPGKQRASMLVNHRYHPFPGVELKIQADQTIWVKSPMTIAPNQWIATGDLGRCLENGQFEWLGRATRQLCLKGVKYSPEPIEQMLACEFQTHHLAILQSLQGPVLCMVGSTQQLPSLTQINERIRRADQDFPLTRRVVSLPDHVWPLTAAGKTDWSALQKLLVAELR